MQLGSPILLKIDLYFEKKNNNNEVFIRLQVVKTLVRGGFFSWQMRKNIEVIVDAATKNGVRDVSPFHSEGLKVGRMYCVNKSKRLKTIDVACVTLF